MSGDRMNWRDVGVCPGCGEPPIGPGRITFHRVTARRAIVNVNRAQQHVGLTAMMGGHAAIADALGDAEIIDLPRELETTISVCEACAATKSIGQLLQAAAERE